MDVEITGTDPYGCEAYRLLFETILNDVGKATLIEKTVALLKPEIPLFIFGVRLINEPVSKTIFDVASIRQEGDETHLSISDEKYAPEILSQLWKEYGRDNVEQQTRFDLTVAGGDENRISSMEVSSGEEIKNEIVGALWRVMPEGIKARHNISDGNVITIVATEEVILQDMVEKGKEIHGLLGGVV